MKFIYTLNGLNAPVQLVVSGFYRADNSPRLDLVDAETGEPWATCTVCMQDKSLDEKHVYIKDYSENEGMSRMLAEEGVIHPLPVDSSQGMFKYELTKAAMELIAAARAKELA